MLIWQLKTFLDFFFFKSNVFSICLVLEIHTSIPSVKEKKNNKKKTFRYILSNSTGSNMEFKI